MEMDPPWLALIRCEDELEDAFESRRTAVRALDRRYKQAFGGRSA